MRVWSHVFAFVICTLLAQWCNADKIDNSVFNAIENNNLKALDRALSTGSADLAKRNDRGLTPLLLAAYLERQSMVPRLRSAKPNLDFFEACVVGDLKRLRTVLARGQDVDERSPDGFTPLGLAVFFRQPLAARLLIDAGADLNASATNAQQVAPIHAAIARADIATLGLLLERGADPNLAQQKLVRPIHDAAASGNLAATAMLLMFNADARSKTEEGNSPADLAKTKGHVELARQLERYVLERQ
jgi:uncharacterized protein